LPVFPRGQIVHKQIRDLDLVKMDVKCFLKGLRRPRVLADRLTMEVRVDHVTKIREESLASKLT